MALFSRRILRLGPQIASLEPISRRVVQVLAAAVVLTVLGLGIVVLTCRSELSMPSRLTLGFTAFLTVFWGFRFTAQLWYSRVWPPREGGRIAHFVLLGIFATQALLYASVALKLARAIFI
jgi:hypothetical protein